MINKVNIYHKIAINTVTQFGSKVLSILLSLVSVSFLTRYLGTEGYGNYTLVFTYISFFAIVSDIGFNVMVVREFSRNEKKSAFAKATFLNLKFILVGLSVILPIIGLVFFPYSIYLKSAIIIGTFAVAVGNLSSYGTSILQSQVSLGLVALVDLLAKIVTVAAIVCFTRLNLGFYYIVGSVLVGNLAGLLVSLFFVRDQLTFKLYLDRNLVQKLLKMGLPVGLTAFLSLAYFKIDTLLLSILKSPADVGIYGLSYKVLENVLMFWGLYMASVFPLLSRYYGASDSLKYRDLLRKSLLALFGLSLCTIAFGFGFAPLVMRILGGSHFFSSILPFKILLFAIPFFLLNNLFYNIILSFGRTKYLILPLVLSLTVNVVLNLLLIPKYGFIGASYVTVACELLTAIAYFFLIFNSFKQEKSYWKVFT